MSWMTAAEKDSLAQMVLSRVEFSPFFVHPSHAWNLREVNGTTGVLRDDTQSISGRRIPAPIRLIKSISNLESTALNLVIGVAAYHILRGGDQLVEQRVIQFCNHILQNFFAIVESSATVHQLI